MTRQEIQDALDCAGIYYDPDHPDHISADKLDTLPPPFMEWGTEDIRIRADGLDYLQYKRLTVFVYTDVDEDIDSVEMALQEIAGSFKKEKIYNDSLRLYEVRYTTEV